MSTRKKWDFLSQENDDDSMEIVEFKNFSIKRQTKGRIPTLPFVSIKEEILGKDYDLSLFFPNQKISKELHRSWKKKSGPVDILSFPLDKNSGEIILTLNKARLEAKKYQHSYREHLVFLFIHGCLHLKGMTHGASMNKEEKFCIQNALKGLTKILYLVKQIYILYDKRIHNWY